MKTFVIGDIHGNFKGLCQCLERSSFDMNNDKLISLGDVCDGFPEVGNCAQLLLEIENLVVLWGNHDVWAKEFIDTGIVNEAWYTQGGKSTYYDLVSENRKVISRLMGKMKPYLIEEFQTELDLTTDKRLFVHGGFNPSIPIENQDLHFLTWDRSLWDNRHKWMNKAPKGYEKVYVGHTSVWSHYKTPYTTGSIWFMDTGGGMEGKISIMDIETEEIWQSDHCYQLYPNFNPR